MGTWVRQLALIKGYMEEITQFKSVELGAPADPRVLTFPSCFISLAPVDFATTEFDRREQRTLFVVRFFVMRNTWEDAVDELQDLSERVYDKVREYRQMGGEVMNLEVVRINPTPLGEFNKFACDIFLESRRRTRDMTT